MKIVLVTLFFSFFLFQLQGQSIGKQVIGASGKSMLNGNHIINFTVGESIVGKIDNASSLNQGFWVEINNDSTLAADSLITETEINGISVFPNPAISYVEINFKLKEASNYQTKLFGITGKEVFNSPLNSQGFIKSITISHLPAGMYVLLVKDKQSNFISSFKILKQ